MKKKLSKPQGLCTMILFLDRYYAKTGSGDIGAMLGALSLLSDGKTADPAFWDDWMDAAKKVLGERESVIQGLTELQAFKTMRVFLEDFNSRGHFDDVEALLSVLKLHEDDKAADPLVWSDWLESVEEVLKTKEGFCPPQCMLVLKK